MTTNSELRAIHLTLNFLLQVVLDMRLNMATKSEIEKLTAKVERAKSVQDSALALINGLRTQLTEALENDDTDALQKLADDLDAHSEKLAAALEANTPAAQPDQIQDQPQQAPVKEEPSGPSPAINSEPEPE